MYRVVYQLPYNCIREVFMRPEELKGWLKWNWLKERIISYEKVN